MFARLSSLERNVSFMAFCDLLSGSSGAFIVQAAIVWLRLQKKDTRLLFWKERKGSKSDLDPMSSSGHGDVTEEIKANENNLNKVLKFYFEMNQTQNLKIWKSVECSQSGNLFFVDHNRFNPVVFLVLGRGRVWEVFRAEVLRLILSGGFLAQACFLFFHPVGDDQSVSHRGFLLTF